MATQISSSIRPLLVPAQADRQPYVPGERIDPGTRVNEVYGLDAFPHVGDHAVLTGAVRNVRAVYPELKFARPDKYDGLWDNNDDFIPVRPTRTLTKVRCAFCVPDEQRDRHGNLVESFTRTLCRLLDIPLVPLSVGVPVFVLTDAEREAAKAWNGKWLVNSNCQDRSITKGYPHWQAVIDGLVSLGFKLVQIGGNEVRDITLNLRGVEDMRGKTSLRDLVVMAAGADGVVSPPSCISNISAAFGTPSVVVNAGREPDGLLDYPNTVHVSHRCSCGWGVETGCMAQRGCPFMVRTTDGRLWSKCQFETHPRDVVAAVLKARDMRNE